MVVARRRGVMGGGTTAHVGWCTSVRGTGEGKRMGVVEERESRRARARQDARNVERDWKEGRRKEG